VVKPPSLVLSTLISLGMLLAAAPSRAQSYDPQQQAALAYYARHYPAYYQRHYGGLRRPATPSPQPSPQPAGQPSPQPAGHMAPSYGAVRTPDAPSPVIAPHDDTAQDDTAQDDTAQDDTAQDDGERTLDGYTFHVPQLVDSPFVATNIHAGTSIELYRQQEVHSRYEAANGTPRELVYDRNLVLLRLRYGVDFALSEAFAIGLDADYLAEVGANDESLLLRGGQTGFDFRPHAVVRLHRDETGGHQLALRGYGTFSAGIRAVPQGMLNALADQIDDIAADPQRSQCLAGGDFDCALGEQGLGGLGKVTRKRDGGGAALSYAHAFNDTAAFQLAAGAEAARMSLATDWAGAVTATQVLGYAGIAPSLDFAPTFPLGLTLGYRFELARSSYDANDNVGIERGAAATAKNHRFSGGAYYTGRRDLMLGWVAGIALLEDAESSVLEAASSPDSLGAVDNAQPRAMLISAQFEMRYFF
jgi:hypothetical protein